MKMCNKVSKVRVNLEEVPTPDIIHLNKETSDILNIRLLKATLQMSKMESSKTKTQGLLRKVRVENKALKVQFQKLQDESIKVDGQVDKGALAQKLLEEKEREIQVLKKKLKIPSTQLMQTAELFEFEKEKQALNTELTDWKDKLLKLEEKEKQWEKEAKFLRESEEDLKVKL